MARAPRRRQQMDKVTKILLTVFAIVGLLLAILGGRAVYNLVKGWSMTSLPGAPVVEANSNTNTTGSTGSSTSMQTNNSVAGQKWNGHTRVNILLLGLDYSDERAAQDFGPSRSDTMMLVTIDPLTKNIGVLSIRRDLWVNIPGYDYAKINEAYFLGERDKLPGGGPGMAMKTVEEFLGVPIQFYAQVNFDAFVKLVDEIGGVKLDIKERILIDPYAGSDDEPFYLEPGVQTLPGIYALAYARVRYTDGDDVARGSRQMEVITAIRDRILDFKMLPKLVAKAPDLYDSIKGDIQTNMTLEQAIQLATLMVKIPRENMKTYNIDYTMVTQEWTADGTQEILRPIPDKIRILRDQVFSAEGAAAAPVTTGTKDALKLALGEKARIQFLNGTSSAGLAEKTGAFFTGKGLNVVAMSNSGQTSANTTIEVHNATPYTLAYLSQILKVPSTRIFNKYDPNNSADITVYLGEDWLSDNPMK